jgi:hypothetical protein
MNKQETLSAALTGRNEEIENYQINIDNYERAIAKINAEYANNEKMIEFRDRLKGLLAEHYTEQLKAIIMRDVVADQLAEMEAP